MRRFLCALLLLPALCAAAAAQYTTVTASKIQSNVSGALLPTGYFALTPVNQAGQPTGLTVFGGGQVLPNTYYWPISQGAISGVSVPDVSIATPTGIGYRVSITDANRIPLYTYTQAIYPSGGTWDFDTWSPSSTAQATPAGALIYGSQAPTGRCTAPSLYYYGSGTVTQLNCVGGTWTPMASGGSMVYPGAGIPVSTGSAWLSSLAAPSGALVGTTDTQALTNKTLDGVTPATMAYLDATSSIQTQLNARQGTLTLTTTGSSGPATLNGSTLNIPTYSFSMVYPAAGVAVSNGSAWLSSLAAPAGALVGATDTQSLTNKTLDGVTPATMAYLDATSSIQTQLNARQGTLTLTTTGSSGPATLSGSTLNIPSYSSPIATVFGRTGNVAAASGDYTAAQVTNAADLTAANGWAAPQTAPAFFPQSGSAGPQSYVFNDFFNTAGVVGGGIGVPTGQSCGASITYEDQNHPGNLLAVSGTGGAGTGETCEYSGSATLASPNGSVGWLMESAVDVPVLPLTTAGSYQFGGNNTSVNPWIAGVGFYLSSTLGSNDWYCRYGTTQIDSTVAATTSWARLTVWSDGTNVHWLINGTPVCGTVPASSLSASSMYAGLWSAVAQSATSVVMAIDYFTFERSVAR